MHVFAFIAGQDGEASGGALLGLVRSGVLGASYVTSQFLCIAFTHACVHIHIGHHAGASGVALCGVGQG